MKQTISKNNNLVNQLTSKKNFRKKNKLIILSTPSLAEKTHYNLKKSFDEGRFFLLPHSETLPYDFFSSSAKGISKALEI